MNRRTNIIVWGVVALVFIGTAAYVALDRERTTLDATARAGAPGKFVQLRDGITHYDFSGPDTGRIIVLLSGATVPFYIWGPTRDALAANSFRVLRHDYFSRGFSDRPKLRCAEFHAIDGAAHLPQIEQATVVDSVLLSFLRRTT